jgi:hypothetical protein
LACGVLMECKIANALTDTGSVPISRLLGSYWGFSA